MLIIKSVTMSRTLTGVPIVFRHMKQSVVGPAQHSLQSCKGNVKGSVVPIHVLRHMEEWRNSAMYS